MTQRCCDPDKAPTRPDAPDWIIQGQVAADAPDLIIRGRTRIRRSKNKKEQQKPHDSKGRSKVYGRLGGEHSGRIKQQEPPPPRTGISRDKRRKAPRMRSSGAEQEGAATTPRAGSSGKKWPAAPGKIARGETGRATPQPPGWSIQGKVASRGEGNERPRPSWSSDGVMSGSNAKDNAMEMQRNGDEDEAEETQCSNEEEGIEGKRRNRPMNEAAVIQSISNENKAVVL